MKFEDLLTDNTQSSVQKSKLLEQRLIAIRQRNRGELLNKIDTETHRMETITTFRGVCFVNDSKSENINATYYCLEQMKSQVIWIVGGNDSLTDYSALTDLVPNKVKAIVCMNKECGKIKQTFNGLVPVILECNDMDTAVRQAFYAAQKGDIVLLSTACPCDHQFADYKQRGTAFRKSIAQL